jgi:hypothetical protein
MKKSRSSVPRFIERWPVGPAPPVRNEGLFATAGRPEPVPPLPPAGPFVAMAVGKTKEGESLPAKPVDRRKVNNELASVKAWTSDDAHESTGNWWKEAVLRTEGRGIVIYRLTKLREARAAIMHTQLLAMKRAATMLDTSQRPREHGEHTCP